MGGLGRKEDREKGGGGKGDIGELGEIGWMVG